MLWLLFFFFQNSSSLIGTRGCMTVSSFVNWQSQSFEQKQCDSLAGLSIIISPPPPPPPPIPLSVVTSSVCCRCFLKSPLFLFSAPQLILLPRKGDDASTVRGRLRHAHISKRDAKDYVYRLILLNSDETVFRHYIWNNKRYLKNINLGLDKN